MEQYYKLLDSAENQRTVTEIIKRACMDEDLDMDSYQKVLRYALDKHYRLDY